MSSGPPPAILTGPPIVALSLSCILFGVLCVQVYLYGIRFPRDSIALKLFVAIIFFANSVQIILLHIFTWEVLVTGKAIQGNAVTPTPSSGIHSILTCIISAMVQGFFAWRIYSLRKESLLVKCVAVLIILLAVMQSISNISGVSLFLAAGGKASDVQLLRNFSRFVELWLVPAVVCDLFIAVAMTWILILFRRASINRTTKSLIKSVILRSVETGTVTFIFMLINLVLFLIYPDNYLFMIFERSLSKLYTNALMLSLNARRSGAKVGTTDWAGSALAGLGDAGLRLSVVSGNRFTTTTRDTTTEIRIAKTIETESETRTEDPGRFEESRDDRELQYNDTA